MSTGVGVGEELRTWKKMGAGVGARDLGDRQESRSGGNCAPTGPMKP